jgi:cell division protein ZapA
MSKVSIKVNIAGRNYPLTVKESEKAVIEKAVELIEKKMADYSNNYAVTDKQDLLAMCALQFSTQYMNAEAEYQDFSTGLSERVHEIEHFISDYLKKDKAEHAF